ncbi:MAG: segregation/condensation protein A [Planctomycetota bacterium]|nr:segregation/condensation protein A [Planctomycetota bacterium]
MAPVLGIADPVEILLNTVRDGKMDPWQIDIIKVTDGFLQELDRIGQDDPQLLARSARCIFYASALVHLKAQVLNDSSLLMDEDDFVEDDDFLDYERPARLERPLFYPRADAPLVPRDRRPRGRSLTLSDLLDALKRLETETMAADDDYDDPWDVPIFDEDIRDIPTAHEDDLEGDILNLREIIRGRFDADDKAFSLDDLRGEMTRGIAFRALLFLAHDGEIEMEQEDFYQEVTIVPGSEPLKEVTEEEKLKRQSHEDRRVQAREERKKRRSIPRPNNRRGRKLTRRPGLSPAASSRRPKSRLRGPRMMDRKAPEIDEPVFKKPDEQT